MIIPIKNISITQYLVANGFKPVKSAYGSTWFSSPLRTGDRTPSFKVDENKNVWFDFGLGNGGTLFTLLRDLYRISDREVFAILEGLGSSFLQTAPELQVQSCLGIDQVIPLQSPLLVEYLTSRAINLNYARRYLSQIHYTIRNTRYFALGFQNDKGGWELRNRNWKGSNSPKYFRTIPGKEPGLNVFEGFMDFLSALSHFRSPVLNNTTIVLNSVSFIKDLIPLLNSYMQVNLFFDNDTAGEEASRMIIQSHSNTKNQANELYPNYKDFNDMLKATKSIVTH
jgi:5S rRNA maturation endonuclease (ribonuclease M5)